MKRKFGKVLGWGELFFRKVTYFISFSSFYFFFYNKNKIKQITYNSDPTTILCVDRKKCLKKKKKKAKTIKRIKVKFYFGSF